MTVGHVKDFTFPNSGVTHVRGYARGGRQEPMATGGMVSPPKSGVRPPHPTSAVKAEKYAETMAVRPGRGSRIGAKITISKPARAPAPKAPVGALQSATTPMIPPPAMGPSTPPAMAKGGRMTAAQRNALPKGKFAGPDRSYPVDTHNRAANAKARASQAMNAGRMSKAQAERIDAKADRVLGEKV